MASAQQCRPSCTIDQKPMGLGNSGNGIRIVLEMVCSV